MLVTKSGKTQNVAPDVLFYWLGQGWVLDLDGNGTPDQLPGSDQARGITSAIVQAGRLLLTFTDGTTSDVGQVGTSQVTQNNTVMAPGTNALATDATRPANVPLTTPVTIFDPTGVGVPTWAVAGVDFYVGP